MSGITAPRGWSWTRPPLGGGGPPVAVVTTDLFAGPPRQASAGSRRPPSARLDYQGGFDRLSIGRDPCGNPPPQSDDIRPELDIYLGLEVPEPPLQLARTAVIVTPHRSMGRYLLHHYAGTYEPWRFDAVSVQHDGQVTALTPDQTMLVEPRRWYRVRLGVIYGFVTPGVAEAYLDAYAHTELWLWLDDPTMRPLPPAGDVSGDGDPTEVAPPEPQVRSPVRTAVEARAVAHAYGHLLGGHPRVLTAQQLARHITANRIEDVPVAKRELTKIIRNVMYRLRTSLGWERTGPPEPGEVAAGLMLLHHGIIALQGPYAVVHVDEGDGGIRRERVRIDHCHLSLSDSPKPAGTHWEDDDGYGEHGL